MRLGNGGSRALSCSNRSFSPSFLRQQGDWGCRTYRRVSLATRKLDSKSHMVIVEDIQCPSCACNVVAGARCCQRVEHSKFLPLNSFFHTFNDRFFRSIYDFEIPFSSLLFFSMLFSHPKLSMSPENILQPMNSFVVCFPRLQPFYARSLRNFVFIFSCPQIKLLNHS